MIRKILLEHDPRKLVEEPQFTPHQMEYLSHNINNLLTPTSAVLQMIEHKMSVKPSLFKTAIEGINEVRELLATLTRKAK
jgi:hypothetical protein